MSKPRIFLGSSGKQAKLLQSLTRGLEEVADVEPWTTTFNPGISTLERLVELTHEVDFAAFVFAQDDWTTDDISADAAAAQASPRDNVVFEAGLFGGVARHAADVHPARERRQAAQRPARPDERPVRRADHARGTKEINQKLRKAIEAEGRLAAIEGLWWQYSLTARSELEPSAISLLRITRDRSGGLEVKGDSWQEDGTLSARYRSEASKEKTDPSGVRYFWTGERPRDPNAPQLEGAGEIHLESADRAAGFWTTRSSTDATLNMRTSGIYVRADRADLAVLDGSDTAQRAALIAQRLDDWKAIANS